MCNAHVTWAFVQMSMSSHILTGRVRGQNDLKTKSELLPESREQPGVGGVGGEEEGGGAVAWRGWGKTHLEGGHLALKLRGLGSR